MPDRRPDVGPPGLLNGPWQDSQPLVDPAFSGDTAPLAIVGGAASAFTWSDAAVGLEVFTGVAASTFTFSDGANGLEILTGTAASAFGFSDGATGALTFTGMAASTFTWSDAGTGVALVAITAVGASSFGFGSAAVGEVPTTGGGMWRPFRLRLEPGLNAGAAESRFGFRARANGVYVPLAISALGSSDFAALASAIGVFDDTPNLDERRVFGFGDEDLIGI